MHLHSDQCHHTHSSLIYSVDWSMWTVRHCMELACTQHTVSHSTPGADWGRKAALAYTDEAAHFWECPRGTHPRLQEGSWRFDKFLENDLPNGEESRISDDLIHLQKRFMKAYTHLRCSHLCNGEIFGKWLAKWWKIILYLMT